MIGMAVLAFSLSIDAVGIGLSYGIRNIKIPLPASTIIGAVSFFIISLSMLLGKSLCSLFSNYFGEIIGTIILFIMGVWIVFQGLKKQKQKTVKKEKTVFSFIIKSMGITIKIIRTPELCDLNKSSIIEPSEALYLGMALSFDSIGVGITSSALGFNGIIFPVFVCIFQIIFLNLGFLFGKKATKIEYIDKISPVLSGGILMGMAVLKFVLQFF